ncbi:CAAX prenyl protease-like protein [Thermoflavifilum aggregans]|uniref:CAAX prenyl protease-like protein n=1 Tax=Thermoflavifilum aggregans TaxID=454188 RepID=A0A2M9CX44_9BACT|nr:type II CAAX endopeptidase family protein [Thermoflavifilum aggregans]PJJ76463.1 CAAX prenyl protease-like protein [Thermoflavifilum aggregans]
MKKQSIYSLIVGFLVLFVLYHLAEYMIMFRNSAPGFLLMQALFFVAAYLIARWQFGKGLAVWGLLKNKNLVKQILVGLCVGATIYGVTFYLSILSGAEHVVQVLDTSSILKSYGLFVFGNFFSSFSEDILTRGYVFSHANQKMNEYIIILLSATIYLFNHIYRLDDGWETYTYLFLLGILLVIPLVKTGQIWTTGCIHWAGNCTFYFTHEVIKSSPGNGIISPNMILSGVMIIFIYVFYFFFKKFQRWLSVIHYQV